MRKILTGWKRHVFVYPFQSFNIACPCISVNMAYEALTDRQVLRLFDALDQIGIAKAN